MNGRTASVDAARLWAGGLATAAVVGLIAVVGVLISRAVFDVAVLAPRSAGPWGAASTAWYAFGAAFAAVLATALAHLLLSSTPRPMQFFSWLMVLATAVAVLVPMVADADLAARLAVSVLNLVLGVAIGTLVAGTAASAVRSARPSGADQFTQWPE